MYPIAERGSKPPGIGITGTSSARADSASLPPLVTTTRRAPRKPAASKQASVSSVLPEYEQHSTVTSGVVHGGSP